MFSVSLYSAEYNIGLPVWSRDPKTVKGSKDALAEHGFVEGENTEFIYKNTNADQQPLL